MQSPEPDPDTSGNDSLIVDITQHPGYLHVTVDGRNSAANVRQYLFNIHEACIQRKCTVVLIEENLQGPGLGIGTIHDIVSQASKKTRPVVTKIAYVDVNKEHLPGPMGFAETVAVNRGVNVRVFSDVDKARLWLDAGMKRP
jgi:hypothetical protein